MVSLMSLWSETRVCKLQSSCTRLFHPPSYLSQTWMHPLYRFTVAKLARYNQLLNSIIYRTTSFCSGMDCPHGTAGYHQEYIRGGRESNVTSTLT